MDALGGMVLVITLGALAAYVLLFIAALISIVTSTLDGAMKVVWLIFAFIAPFIGSLLWFLVGRKRTPNVA
ncbi:PLD nuclease N-terminal domain-containing protein [Saccharopolyspora rosea]|uniref:PLD nuclease N-terminal domain-containing protein n=1 Tax=Saccharopolyspora rosea TaxID=524884 RepID=A0ABW3FYN7_9PSEU|nr:PLD nuclease N-terminal domain-containing protein [Saccharopolyspora rosea]